MRSKQQPSSISYIFLQDGETETARLTYEELNQQALSIAVHLRSVISIGERALLMYPSGLEFITAFFGCLYAGVVAVPVYPPKSNQKLSRLLSIVDDAQANVALTTTSIMSNFDKRCQEEAILAHLKLIATDTIKVSHKEYVPNFFLPKSLAFLQYTSGSTGTPKGVMVTHKNIIQNQQLISEAFGHSERTIVLGWLPLFHDMGLIGNVLQPIYLGIPCILMPPVAFLQKPIRWLKAISRYRATTSGGPNFAYDLCVKKIKTEQLINLDLSSWDLAFNGAEPIRAETLKQFNRKFASCGFNYSTFYPCFGMAESTLFITGGNKNQKPVIQEFENRSLEKNLIVKSEISSERSRALVGCGHPHLNTKVAIVNPKSLTTCKTSEVGEIWVSGESIALGYWKRPELTQETFSANLKDMGSEPFFRTGDLGFFNNGELFVTGRLKDVIIIRGRNHYPQDIEVSVEKSHQALRANSGAAFSIEVQGEERLVVLHEIERTYMRQINLDEVVSAINQAVLLEHEIAIDTIALLRPGTIPKTSSGKIRRNACRQKFLDGSLQSIVSTKSVQNISTQNKAIEFSLLYFSSDSTELRDDKYQLLLEGGKFADKNSFHAVWIPERHFHHFGGLYPEPAILGSALAMVTEQIRIRPGSVVLPLHNPIRVAEQWSVVDNLSEGRVDISFARGWNPNDFVLHPENYSNRTQIMFDGIETVQKLWQGQSVFLPNGNEEKTEIRIYPSPKQSRLPIWITCSSGKERFLEAGAIGANVLTALLFQSMEELAEKIALYRQSRAKNGYAPSSGRVTLMLHTFVSSEIEFVRSKVEKPFKKYLQSSVDLWKKNSKSLDRLTEPEREKLLAYAFERYFHTSALFGTPSSCLKMVNQLREIGVDEIACLIDFGVDVDSVLSNLNYLNQLRKHAVNVGKEQISQKDEQLTTNFTKHKEWSAQVKIEQQDTGEILNNELLTNIGENLAVDKDKFHTEVEIRADEYSILHGLQKLIIQHISDSLNIESIDLDKSFFALGVDSLKAIELIEILGRYLKIPISETLVFEYPTINQLSKYLVKLHGQKLQDYVSKTEESKSTTDIFSLRANLNSSQEIEIEPRNNQKLDSSNLNNSDRITGKL